MKMFENFNDYLLRLFLEGGFKVRRTPV